MTTSPNPYCPPVGDAERAPRSIAWGFALVLSFALLLVSLAAFCFCTFVAAEWLYDSIVIMESPELPLYFVAPVVIYAVALIASASSVAYARKRKLWPWSAFLGLAVAAWFSVEPAVLFFL